MASEVGICNLALAHLGDTATIASINPPDGSAQAAHCATFYPMARDALLEMYAWGFATKRRSIASLGDSPWTEWQYVYAVPADMVNVISVLSPDATDDYSVGLGNQSNVFGTTLSETQGAYTPQTYSCESLEDGTSVIYTNMSGAVLRYTARITDTTKFSPLFVIALSHLLASYVAGSIIKGEVGVAAGNSQLQLFQNVFAKAAGSDANQRKQNVQHNVPWMAGR